MASLGDDQASVRGGWDRAAKPVGRARLPRRGNVVSLALYRHKGCILDFARIGGDALHKKSTLRQKGILENIPRVFDEVIRIEIHDGCVKIHKRKPCWIVSVVQEKPLPGIRPTGGMP